MNAQNIRNKNRGNARRIYNAIASHPHRQMSLEEIMKALDIDQSLAVAGMGILQRTQTVESPLRGVYRIRDGAVGPGTEGTTSEPAILTDSDIMTMLEMAVPDLVIRPANFLDITNWIIATRDLVARIRSTKS